MANRDLGMLTRDLVVKIGGLTHSIDKAQRASDTLTKAMQALAVNDSVRKSARQQPLLQTHSWDAMLEAGQSTFSQLAQLAVDYAGDTSDIYRALFAVEQGFEIARSTYLDIREKWQQTSQWYAEQRQQLTQWYAERQQRLADALDHELITETEYQQAKLKLYADTARQQQLLQAESWDAMLEAGQSTFGKLTQLAADYAGNTSGIYRALFAVEQGFEIARSMLAVHEAIVEATAKQSWLEKLLGIASAAVPFLGEMFGLAMPAGVAHAGINHVPQTGTWLLQKGERVTTAQTATRLDRTLAQLGANPSPRSAVAYPQHIRIVNTVDPELVKGYLGSDDGERLILNVIGNNPSLIKKIVSA